MSDDVESLNPAEAPQPTTFRLASLINKTEARRFTLETAAKLRAHKFTRVSPQFLTSLEGEVKELIRRKIMQLPSVGKTIQ